MHILTRSAIVGIAALVLPSGAARTQVTLATSTTMSTLPAPSGVTVSGTAGAVTVAWGAVSTSSTTTMTTSLSTTSTSSVTYRVLRSSDPAAQGADLGAPTAATSFVDATAAAGSTYYYQVVATQNGVTSASPKVAYSVPAAVSTTLASGTVTFAIAPPASFTAQSAAGGVQLAWSPVSGATSYMVSGPGLPAGGASVTGTSYLVSGLAGPAPYQWSVVAVSQSSSRQFTSAPVTASGWVTAPGAGFATPRLPAPAFTGQPNLPYGATTDHNGMTVRLSPTPTDASSCPLVPMFYWNAASPPMPAAPFYRTTSATATAQEKYPFLYGAVYFRPPVIPGIAFVDPASPSSEFDAWFFVANCRGQYSNPVPFRMYSTEFRLSKAVTVEANVIAGGKMTIIGTGLAPWKNYTNAPPYNQKVIFFFTLVKGTQSYVRELEATVWSNNEQSIAVDVPSIEALGFTSANSALTEAKVYVVKDGVRSNELPIRYCSVKNSALTTGPCW